MRKILEHFINIAPEDRKLKEKYLGDVQNLLNFSYKNIGGPMNISSWEDLLDSKYFWKLNRKDNKINACVIYKISSGGRKLSLAGCDGTVEGKKSLFNILREDVEQEARQAWGEYSGSLEHILTSEKYGINATPIPNYIAKEVLKTLGKDVISLSDDGFHYTRIIGGKEVEKIMLGNVPPKDSLKNVFKKESIMEIKSNNIIVEAKEDKEKFINWLVDAHVNSGMNKELATQVANRFVNKFLELKSRIKSPYNDFYYWMKNSTPNDFIDYLNKLSSEVKAKQEIKQKQKDGARLVYSDNDWKVYEITTYEASAKYGKGTKWCIAGSKRWANGEHGKGFFDDYYNQKGIKFYYFINKEGHKWALAVYPNDSMCEIFNEEDVKVAFIPNAPVIDEIKVKYNDNSDNNILVNAIMSGQIQESVLLQVMEEVIYDNSGAYIDIFNNANDFVAFLDDNIPDGYLEYEAVTNGDMSEEEYESLTGEEYDDSWDGDLPNISYDYDDSNSLQYTSKEKLLNPNNFKNTKYWFCIDNEAGFGIEIYAINDFVSLYVTANDACGISNWDTYDVEEFYGSKEGGSRADIFGIMCANQLTYDIKNKRVSKNVLNGLGLSKNYLDSLGESLIKEDMYSEVEDKLGVTNEPFKGPSYILPNGKFLKIYDAKVNLSSSGKREDTIHSDVQRWLQRHGLAKHDQGVYVDSNDLEEKAIRVNTNYLEHYIVLPKEKPNKEQFNSLIKWIDFFWSVSNQDLRLVSYYGPSDTYFHGSVAEDIVDDIKDYYRRGMFFEDLSKEQEVFFKDSKIVKNGKPVVMYHGTNVNFSEFKGTIKWFSISRKYAEMYANWLHDNGIGGEPVIYEAYLNCKNPLNCGNTNEPIYNMVPIKPYKFSNASLNLIKKLGLTEGQFRSLVELENEQVPDNNDKDGYKKKLHVITRMPEFADLVKEKGYDSIITFEDGNLCVGVFNANDIKRIDNLNPTLSNNIDEDFVPTEEDFPFTMKDIENKYPDLFSNNYESYGNAFILPDGRFINSGKRFATHGDFSFQCLMVLGGYTEEQIENEWSSDSTILDAFCRYFNLCRCNDGTGETEDRAYFVVPIIQVTSSQWDSLTSFVDYIINNRFKLKAYDIQAFIKNYNFVHKKWYLDDPSEIPFPEDIIEECKEAQRHGYFTENLNEYFDDVEFDSSSQFPVYATDEPYRIKSLLTKGDKAYRIYYDNSTNTFYMQDAHGDKTHGEMLEVAKDNGWITSQSSLGEYLETDWEGYMVFIPFNYDKQLRWHTSLGEDGYCNCRVYPYGVVFVRDSFAFDNPLFTALGEPEREIFYNESEYTTSIDKDNKTYDLDLDDPNEAITLDVKTIEDNNKETDNKEDVELDIEDIIDTDDLDYDDIERESLQESKQDIEKFKQWAGDELANRFFKLKDRLKGQERDIYYWMSTQVKEYGEHGAKQNLSMTLRELERTPTRREIDKAGKEDAIKIYEDSRWLVLKILSYEAAVKYGKGTQWCITGNNTYDGRWDFDDHTGGGYEFYFYLTKKGQDRNGSNKEKYCLQFKDMNDWKLWDEADFIEVQSNSDFPEDEWNPFDTHGKHIEFPNIQGLPDLNKAYEDQAKKLGWDKEVILEELNDNVLDALDKEFGQEEVYMWSTYILPNGHFLNPDNSTYFEDNDVELAYEHCDFENWAVDNGYGRDLSPIYDNCIKMNVTYPYLSMPDKAKPTQEQFNAIRKVLDRKDLFEPEGNFYWYDIFPKEKVDSMGENLLAVYTPVGDELFDLDVSDANDIIKAINRAYIRGGFFSESLNEYNTNKKEVKKNFFNQQMRYFKNMGDSQKDLATKTTQDHENDFDSVVDFCNNLKFPLKVYRGLLWKDKNQIDLNNLGVHWTIDKNFINRNNFKTILVGEVNEEDVDWKLTQHTYVYYSANKQYPENEIWLKKNAKPHNLKVYSLDEFKQLNEKIVKLDNGKWQVQSEDGTKNLGTYDTKKEAEDRLKQVHYFKHMNEDKEDYQKKFDERTHAHIDRVNKYAKKIGKEYPHHDEDKFNELYDGYSLMSKNKEDITKEEQAMIDDATFKHVINNEHHCEHWVDPKDIEGFSRDNPTPHGCLDCSKMPESALEEMCCDWCAMSEEFGNTPFEWYEKNKDTRWHFNEEQDKFILDTLHKLWDSNQVNEDYSEGDFEDVYYRGYDSRYDVFDSDNEYGQLYTWITDEPEYALEYAKNNKYGKVAKVKVTCDDKEIGGVLDLPEDVDYYEPGDEEFKEHILDQGLKGYGFEAGDYDDFCICISKDCVEVIDPDVKVEVEEESLNESKEDFEKFKAWCNNDELYNKFMQLRPRLSNIKFDDGSKGDDIYFWMKNNTPKDLEDTLQDLEATPTKKEKEKKAQEGAKLLYNQNGWKVYKIETQEASQKYGKGSMWCISGEGGYDLGDGYWEGHEDNTYFFIHGNEKYALIWHKGDSVWDIWNEEDEIIPYIPNAPKIEGLPDVSKLPDFITSNVAKLYNISVDDIKDVKSASNDPELMELFLDYDSKQNYIIELKDGTTKYCYVEEFTDFVDVTDEILEYLENNY